LALNSFTKPIFDFSVSLKDNEVLLYWDDLGRTAKSCVCGNAQFLIAEDRLLGMRFFALSDQGISLLSRFPLIERKGSSPGN
jgi:hypothetical protein